jgi:putative transposase
VAAEKDNFPIEIMCEVLKVSRSGYYAWLRRPESNKSKKDRELLEKIQEIHKGSRESYGSPRIREALKQKGVKVGRRRVMRLMKEEGIEGKGKKKYKATTSSKHNLPVAENVLQRDFKARGPDQKWVADITYIPTCEGWLYLAIIIDLYSRKVVGWSMSANMKIELVSTALEAALGQRVPDNMGLIFHSDRGSQYASKDYKKILEKEGIKASMSRKGNCWDNAVAESFFGTLKTELVRDANFRTREVARTTIAEWIEAFYNRQRIHSSIGNCTPVAFEENYWSSQSA